jgi:hypothetical protein
MTQTVTPPALPEPARTSSPPQEKSGLSVVRVVIIASAVLVGLVIVILVVSLLIAQGDLQTWSNIVEIFRDMFIIFLALEGILIILALAVLIVQVARLINLIQNEVKPVLTNTQQTVKTAKGTVDFVSDTVSEPLIKASAFMAGFGVVMNNLGGIRRALRPAEESRANGKK